jgi:predicted ATPase
MAALDAQRQTLGDALVDASLAPLQEQLGLLQQRTASSAVPQATSLERQLTHLNQADLIRLYTTEPELAYLFRHALTQEAAYESVLMAKRHEIHRLVAQVFERLYSDRLDEYAPVLAYHYARAGDDVKLVEYAVRAGEAAARAYALAEAVNFSAQAIAALARLPDSAEHRRRRIDLIVKRAPIAWISDTPEQNFSRLAEAETLAQTLPDEHGSMGGDRLRLARVHYVLGSEHMARNELSETIRYAERVLEEAQGLDDSDLLMRAYTVLGATSALRGNFIQAEQRLTAALEKMKPTASFERWEWTGAVGYLSFTLAARGQVAAGIALAQRGLALLRESRNQSHLALLELLQGLAFLLGGDPKRALEAARAALGDARSSGARMYIYFALVLKSFGESRLGQIPAARESLAQVGAIAQELGPRLLLGDWLAAAEAEIALAAGTIAEALALAERAVTFARSIEGTFAEGLAKRVWGQALTDLCLRQVEGGSDWASAEAHLASSLAIFESGGAALEAARTRVALGELHAARGNIQAAKQQWARAAAQFAESGLDAELAQTRKLMPTR